MYVHIHMYTVCKCIFSSQKENFLLVNKEINTVSCEYYLHVHVMYNLYAINNW